MKRALGKLRYRFIGDKSKRGGKPTLVLFVDRPQWSDVAAVPHTQRDAPWEFGASRAGYAGVVEVRENVHIEAYFPLTQDVLYESMWSLQSFLIGQQQAGPPSGAPHAWVIIDGNSLQGAVSPWFFEDLSKLKDADIDAALRCMRVAWNFAAPDMLREHVKDCSMAIAGASLHVACYHHARLIVDARKNPPMFSEEIADIHEMATLLVGFCAVQKYVDMRHRSR